MATKSKSNGGGNLPVELENAFEEDLNLGFEEVTSSDIQIPFLRIIQALSPQIKKSDSEFIEGASQGDIFNTVTHSTWSGDEGIVVIPVYFQTKFLEQGTIHFQPQKVPRSLLSATGWVGPGA